MDGVCTANDLVDRGWSGGMIRNFLPTPDEVSPVPVYKLERVLQIENSCNWKAAFKPVQGDIDFQKVVIDGLELTVPVMKLTDLKHIACESYNRFHKDIGFFKPATLNSDPSFLARIMVNQLRHMIGEYHQLVMKADYIDMSEPVYKAVKQVYPELANECDRQFNRRCRCRA